jgi:hypothetical protein
MQIEEQVRSRRLLTIAAVLVSVAWPHLTPLAAQERLVPARFASIGPVFEQWSFGSGLFQPASGGTGSVELKSASAWSVPLSASIGFGERYTFDISTAYSSGTVQLRSGDASLGTDSYALSGLTDVRTRLIARLAGGALIATVGANLPTGTTSLDAEQFSALRILAAPALAMQSPALGTGFGGTAGLVASRQIGSWAWAAGASYELRRTYTPVAFAAGVAAPDVDPGDALHLTLGTDGLVGEHGMTVALSADLFGDEELAVSAGGGEGTVTTRLGPIFTVDWQLRVATTRLRELTFYVVDRYRTPYERGGTEVDESSGNYADGGIRAVFPLSPSTGLLSVVSVRHQTGLKSDSTLATAATAGAGLTLGLQRSFGGGYELQPFVRAEYARIKSVDASATGTGLSAGISLGRRF